MEDKLHATCQPAVKRQVLNRLHRASGQLESIVAMVEGDGDCRAVVTQLAAVSAAIRRAGFVIVATHMETCLGSCDGMETQDIEELEKLFMMLG
ncbi:MAG: metal-sensitive transcriptional regulator [Micrococcales bacterium]|nr:metal-sensitive transcriptional regulator [Micrococcales bacterium]